MQLWARVEALSEGRARGRAAVQTGEHWRRRHRKGAGAVRLAERKESSWSHGRMR